MFSKFSEEAQKALILARKENAFVKTSLMLVVNIYY